HGTGTVTRIDGNLNAVKYIEILKEELPKISQIFAGQEWYLVHDRSTIHTARIVKQFIDENGINDMKHPPRSPDLNPIENVFAELKRRINMRIRAAGDNGRIRSKDQLFEWVKEAWIEIAQTNFIRNIYRTFPLRFCDVTNRHGENSAY
ncbi:transposase-like protein, partial [Leptotrombidium deliense]